MWEKLTIQEREERIVGRGLSADERRYDLLCQWGRPASARSMGPFILGHGRAGGKYGLRSRSVVEVCAVSFLVTLHYFQECMVSEGEVREEALELEGRSERRYGTEWTREQSWEMKSNCQTVSGCP